MTPSPLRSVCIGLFALVLTGSHAAGQSNPRGEEARSEAREKQPMSMEATNVTVYYLEIVTPSVSETCDLLAKVHGVTFSEPIAELGNARTAHLKNGGRLGVRAPMHDQEKSVVRPYVLVDDIAAAVEAARKAGATVAVPAMEIPGQGTIAIYFLGGIEHGFWQL